MILGTISGLQHFLTHKNDLKAPFTMYKYIDDYTICAACHGTNTTKLQQSMDIVNTWSKKNDMVINTSKTKEMIICFSHDKSIIRNTPNITINNDVLDRVNESKVLGVILSHD